MQSRKPLRRKGHDYSSNATYFITICTFERQEVLAEIIGAKSLLTPIGQIVQDEWLKTLEMRDLTCTPFVIMPNHIHAILRFGNNPDALGFSDWTISQNPHIQSDTLGAAIRGFKAAVTTQARAQNPALWHIWQGKYHEHIIRTQDELDNIRAYIEFNPQTWLEDKFHKKNYRTDPRFD